MTMEERSLPSGEVFFGKRFQSANGTMVALRAGGCFMDDQFLPGRVCVFDHHGLLFAPHGFIRPGHVAVSDLGDLIVGDNLRNTGALHCRVTVHAPSGRLRFAKTLRRNCGGVGISSDGRIALIGTANPQCRIRVLDLTQDPPTQTSEIAGYGFFSDAKIDPESRSVTLDSGAVLTW